MIFKEIIQKYKWKEVTKEFLRIYPDQKRNIKGYELVFKRLQGMKAIKSPIMIELYFSKDKDEKGPYVGTHGIEIKEQPIEGNWIKDWHRNWGIEFFKWNKWLGMTIDRNTEYEFSELEIIVCCLWEMTFLGFREKEIQGYYKELGRRIKKVKKDIKKRRK